jgi:hypothetical protein
MNRTLLVGSLLAAVTAAIHVFLGGRDIAAPLLASTLATEPRLVLYACWHGISVALVLSAVGLFLAALPRFAAQCRSMVFAISLWWLATAVIVLAIIATQPEDGLLWQLQQWTLFIPVGLLGLWNSLRSPRRAVTR